MRIDYGRLYHHDGDYHRNRILAAVDVIPYDADDLLRVVHGYNPLLGQWGEKVHKEFTKYGSPNFLCNTKATKFRTIPSPTEWTLDSEAAYVHNCANETVNGVEFHYTPNVGETPLMGDMSSPSTRSCLIDCTGVAQWRSALEVVRKALTIA